MAKDPVCGMFVEEKPDSIRYAVNGKEYFFCSTQCLNEFREPEKELKKTKDSRSNKYSTYNSDHIPELTSHATGTVWTLTSDELDA